MKKLLSLFLSIIMIMSALPLMVSAEEPTLTDVALNRPGFSSFYNTTYHPQNATDGNTSTRYMYNYAGWYYVDLGAQYTVDSVNLLLDTTYNKNYTVYLSNTRPTAQSLSITDAAISTVGETAAATDANGYTNIEVTDATKYQFVIVQHTARLDILDIKVMTPDTVDANPFYMVEVGAYKPVFAASTNGTMFPYNANDRVANTVYESRVISWTADGTDPAIEQSFIIDLGTAMPLHAVTYWPTNQNRGGGVYEYWRAQNVTIYVTNDPNTLTNANKVVTKNMTNLSNYCELPAAIKGGSYRYVVVQGGAASGNTRGLSITDIGVYSDSTVAQPASSFNTNARTHLISYGMPAKANWDDLSGNANTVALSYPASVTDGDLETEWAVYGGNANDVYIMLDLGKPQTIDYITAMSGSKYSGSNLNRAAEIFVSNTDDFTTTGAVIMHTEDTNGMYPQKRMRLYKATDDMNGNKYRYVGVRIPDRRSITSGQWARTDLVMLDVYTKEANLDEAFTEITFEQDASVETKYSVKANKLLSATGRDYAFIAGAYNSDGVLIDVRISTITPVKGVGAALNASVDFADSDCKDDISCVRTMLWDTKNIRPIVASQAFPPESLISAGKASKQVQFGSGKTDGTNFAWKTEPYAENKNTTFTDGDITTAAGWGPATISGFAFVDLGTAQKISKVTGYAQYERGSAGREVYLSNINPNPTIEEAMALTGETDAAKAVEEYYNLFNSANTDMKYVGNLKTHTATGEFSFDVADAGSYRYVVVKYEFMKASGNLYELRAYKQN